jgi:hypothetical protein
MTRIPLQRALLLATCPLVVASTAQADLHLHRYNSPLGQTSFGFALDGGGDLNGDGIADFVTASVVTEPEVVQTTYIFFGAPEVPLVPSLQLVLPSASNFMDHGISCRGDINGDGYDDLLLGQGFSDFKHGLVEVYFGGDPMDDVADLVMYGENNADWFGANVSILGDINGDGYDDFGVCAIKYDGAARETGRVYLYYGGPEVDAEADLILDGNTELGYFGSTLDGRADINGDGWDDFLVGQTSMRIDDRWKGVIFIYHGGPDLDSEPDLMLVDPEGPWAEFGYINCFAGDLNGDGYVDIAAGDTWGPEGGVVHAFWGGPQMDAISDWRITDRAGITFGNEISPVGDLNGDGADDLLIGDWCSGAFWNPPGRACIAYGARFPDSRLDVIHRGATGDLLGEPVRGIGDFNADGQLDYAATGRDYVNIWSAEEPWVRIDAFEALAPVAHPGEEFSVRVELTNRGEVGISTGLWLEGYLARHPQYNQRLGETALTFAAGETLELILSLDVPAQVPTGEQALMLRIGPDPEEWLNAYLPVEVEAP